VDASNRCAVKASTRGEMTTWTMYCQMIFPAAWGVIEALELFEIPVVRADWWRVAY